MARLIQVILSLLPAIAFYGMAGNLSTAEAVDTHLHAITYAMEQQGEISVPDLFDTPVAELNNLPTRQISVTRMQRAQLGEYFLSLKNALQCCAERANSLAQHRGRMYDTTTTHHCLPPSTYYVYTLRHIII